MSRRIALKQDPSLAAHLLFGAAGNAGPCQISGWSTPEDGFTWCTGETSQLNIPYRPGSGTLTLELMLMPLRISPTTPSQRLTILINDASCASETIATACSLAYPLRAVPPGAGQLAMTLHHPDAASPADLFGGNDHRRLAIALFEIRLYWQPAEPAITPRYRPPLCVPQPGSLPEAVRGCTALSPADLMFRFESIGNNCEFGLVQRRLNAEPVGLLRFAGIWPEHLLQGLRTGFEGIDDPAQIYLETEQNAGREEYVVCCQSYGVRFHSFMPVSETPPDAMRQKMAAHLKFLRRKFLEQLAAGTSIFTLHHPACATEAQARPFLHALRHWGPTALLFVTPDTLPPGSVHQLAPDLFHAHTDRIMRVDHPDDINVPAWLSICANAYRLWREAGLG
jgi:hypothetical protein